MLGKHMEWGREWINKVGGPQSSGWDRDSGVGSPGGSDRPLLSQLPVSPLVSDEPAWMLSPWLHTPQQPLQSGRYLIPLGSTHHFFQENHNILTSSGAWRQECLNAPLKCQAWPPPLPACDEGFHPLEGHFVLVCSVGEYPLLQEVGKHRAVLRGTYKEN